MRAGPARWLMTVALGAVMAAAVGCGHKSNLTLREEATMNLRRGRVIEAQRLVDRALLQDPADWRAQEMRGDLALAQGELLDAQFAYEKALNLAGTDPEGRRLLRDVSEAIYLQDDPAKLQGWLTRMARQYRGADALMLQGEYLSKIGDHDGARTAYRRATVEAKPGNIEPYLALADFQARIGDHAGAAETLQTAHTLAPEDKRIAERMGAHVVPAPSLSAP